MSNVDYITKEVDKIANDKSFEFPKNLAMSAAWILGNLKGVNLRLLDVREQSSLADFFILASATNSTQAQSMADAINVQLKRHGANPISREGVKGDADWTLLDFGDIIVHIFLDESRDFYNLDDLWKDAKPVEIPEEYYYSDSDYKEEKDSDEDYF